jgi:hypothetical protein
MFKEGKLTVGGLGGNFSQEEKQTIMRHAKSSKIGFALLVAGFFLQLPSRVIP